MRPQARTLLTVCVANEVRAVLCEDCSLVGAVEVADLVGDEDVRRWTVWLPLRVTGVLLSVTFIGFGLAFAVIAAAAEGAEILAWLVLALIFAASGVGMFRVVVWPALTATPDGLVIQNPIRSHVVPWDDIERLEPGYHGILVVRRHARPVIAVAVQKSNMATASGATTRADRVIATLAAIAARHEDTGDRQFLPSPERRAALASSARRYIVVGTGSIVVWVIVRLVVT